jgi:hypothetical protein
MSNAAQPSLLRRLMGARAVAMPEPDPADMGTAMGLEEPPIDPTGGGPAPIRQGAPAGWLRRLGAG